MLCILTMTHTMMMFNGTHCRAIEINSEKKRKTNISKGLVNIIEQFIYVRWKMKWIYGRKKTFSFVILLLFFCLLIQAHLERSAAKFECANGYNCTHKHTHTHNCDDVIHEGECTEIRFDYVAVLFSIVCSFIRSFVLTICKIYSRKNGNRIILKGKIVDSCWGKKILKILHAHMKHMNSVSHIAT